MMRVCDPGTIRSTLATLLLTVAVGTAGRAQSPGGGSGSDQYAKWDPKTNTATLELIAGPFKFNDASNGSAGFTVPGMRRSSSTS